MSALAVPAATGRFTAAEVRGLPEPARRHLLASIAEGTPLATGARLRMRGAIRLGRRWVPFRAGETIAPHAGFVWAATAGGVVRGADRYERGRGSMDWRLFGVVPVVRASGPDVDRSAAGRCAGEAIWVPTALLPRFGVTWTATDERHVTAAYRLDGHPFELRGTLDGDARLTSVVFDRWGDADGTGRFGSHPFGCRATAWATFDGVTVPSAGRAGWFAGTDRADDGEFFRFEITDLRLLAG